MASEPTNHQQQTFGALAGVLPRQIDTRTSKSFVLVPETDYEMVQEVQKDDWQQRAIRTMGLRNAIGRMKEEP